MRIGNKIFQKPVWLYYSYWLGLFSASCVFLIVSYVVIMNRQADFFVGLVDIFFGYALSVLFGGWQAYELLNWKKTFIVLTDRYLAKSQKTKSWLVLFDRVEKARFHESFVDLYAPQKIRVTKFEVEDFPQLVNELKDRLREVVPEKVEE